MGSENSAREHASSMSLHQLVMVKALEYFLWKESFGRRPEETLLGEQEGELVFCSVECTSCFRDA
jgi:hypothetical protein